MLNSFAQWLATLGWTAFTWSLAGLLMLNIGALIAFTSGRDRVLVQRYTSLWLAMNLLLVAVGVGVPTLSVIARLALLGASAVMPATSGTMG